MATGIQTLRRTSPTDAPGRLNRNLRAVRVVWTRELIRFAHDRLRIVTSLIQPVLFLFVLGSGLSSLTGTDASGSVSLRTFMFPGVLALGVLFTAMFSAASIVWDREFGFLREMLVAPVSRTGLVLGKAASAGPGAAGQALCLVAAPPIVGASLAALQFLEVIGLLLLLAFALTAFGIVIAGRMQRMES